MLGDRAAFRRRQQHGTPGVRSSPTRCCRQARCAKRWRSSAQLQSRTCARCRGCALEAEGVEFIDENGSGRGVCLRNTKTETANKIGRLGKRVRNSGHGPHRLPRTHSSHIACVPGGIAGTQLSHCPQPAPFSGRYSHPRSRNSARSIPGGAYHPPQR
jgi:hypothetical protein